MKKIFIILVFILSLVSFFKTEAYENKTIVIDPGHGGYDPGAVVDGIEEAEINLEISYELKDVFLENGYNVIMTRYDSNDLCDGNFVKKTDLQKRINIINNAKACYCISIHMNSFPSNKYSGPQIFFDDCNTNNEILAKNINESFKYYLASKREIVKRDNIYMLKRLAIPSCIVECGFMTNKEELLNLLDKNYQRKIALAIYMGSKKLSQ